MSQDRPSRSVSRRWLLRSAVAGVGALAAVPLLGACSTAPTATPAAQPTTAAQPAKPAAQATATTAPSAQAPATAPQQVTLRLHARAGVEDEMFGKILPKFEAAQSGVKVTLEEIPGAEYLQKLQTLAAGGNIGDALYLFTANASYQMFFVNGTLAAIDNYLQRDKVDMAQWYRYSAEACRVDGKMGGLPFKSHPSRVGLFYNEDLFQKAGIDVPNLDWTYDKLVEVAVKLNKPPEVYAFSHPWRDSSYYPIMGRIFGGDFFTKDGMSTELDKPETQKGWIWHYDMMNKHKVTVSPLQTSPTPSDLFVGGQMAMLRANLGSKAGFRRIDKFKWNMTLAPKGPTGSRGSLAETDVAAITKASKNPDQAFELLKAITSREAGIGLAQQSGNRSSTPGGRPDVYESPEHLNLPYPEGVQKLSLQAMNEAEEWRGPHNFRGEEVKRLADEHADLMLLDKVKPDQAFFSKLKSEIQIILDKPRP